MLELATSPSSSRAKRSRPRRDPIPRFLESRVSQGDILLGHLEEQVPRDHLCRRVWAVVEKLDTRELEGKFSSLGRRGFHPKHSLAVWIYASLVGLHEGSKLARACQTDCALKWLCGGRSPSPATLKRRRATHAEFFERAIAQTVAFAAEAGLIDVQSLAVDSVRIRAHASTKQVRTVSRSTERLEELSEVDATSLPPDEHATHDSKVHKHETALAACAERDRTNIVLTNETAGLMKFPSGASGPGHRATVVASGVQSRFVISVFVDGDATDYGKLEKAVTQARDVLETLGLRQQDQKLVVTADAGYCAPRDLAFAERNRPWVDVLVPIQEHGPKPTKFYGHDRFVLHDDGSATCPSGRPMAGPYPNSDGRTRWRGIGCQDCEERPKCTDGKTRTLYVDVETSRLRRAMRERMQAPDASALYNRRIATIEPVFSYLQSSMGFRRVSSRSPKTVLAEILLKLLAYNVQRLIRAQDAASGVLCVRFWVSPDGSYGLWDDLEASTAIKLSF